MDAAIATLDDAATLMRVRAADRQAFLRSEPRMAIDEVQRDPELMLAIKTVVDSQRPQRRGQFVLTGSANLLMMKHVGDSLAGRAYYLRLHPLTRREQLGHGTTAIWSRFFDAAPAQWLDIVREEAVPRWDWREAVQHGGFPAPAVELDDARARSLWFEGYVATWLERDLRDLQMVSNLQNFQSLMQAAVLRIGNLLNHTELGRDVKMPATTVHQYMNLLDTSFQATRLLPYAVNRTRRLIKSPKLYWNDVGLALRSAGLERNRISTPGSVLLAHRPGRGSGLRHRAQTSIAGDRGESQRRTRSARCATPADLLRGVWSTRPRRIVIARRGRSILAR